MNNDYRSTKFKEWLDKLQTESWQLELIISGFAIYGLIMAYEPIEINAIQAFHAEKMVHNWLWGVAGTAVSILILNLIVHVVLRGLWIGAIGLRYVSGDINFESLNYSEKFTNYLKNKVGPFDKFIAKLENLCSVLFALSFLMVFYVLAFFTTFSFLGVFVLIVEKLDFLPKIVMRIMVLGVLSFYIIGILLVIIDFIGQGVLKKREWTSKIYFPFYKVFGFLSLSFLYRPLVYNFLDNKFSRRLSLFIVPVYIGLSILATFDDTQSNYLTLSNKASSENYSDRSNYEDSTLEKDEFISIASIPSKVIQKQYLNVFIAYSKEIEDFIFEAEASLKPEEDKRGVDITFFSDFSEGIKYKLNPKVKKDSILPKYLKTFNDLYCLAIDSVKQKSDFIVSKNANGRIGFETFIGLKTLKEGKHIISISGPSKKDIFEKNTKTIEKTLVTIPFWYYPENQTTATNLINIETDSTTLN